MRTHTTFQDIRRAALPEPGSAGAPLKIVRDSAVLTACQVGGKRTLALIDTGAAMTIVSRALAPAQAAQGVVTAGAEWGRERMVVAAPMIVEIAGHELRVQHPLLSDLSWLEESLGVQVGVVLGLDALAQRVVFIEPRARRLQLFARPPAMTAGFERLSLRHAGHGKLCFPTWIGRWGPVWTTFDLGSSNPLMMSLPAAQGWGLVGGRPMSSALTGTMFGPQVSLITTVSSISIGGFSLADVPVDAFAMWHDIGAPANLGAPAMLRFDMMLDAAKGYLWLRPNSAAGQTFQKNRSGLGVAFCGDSLKVVHVAQHSPASAQWRLDDRITAIDGRAIDASYPLSSLARWREQPTGRCALLEGSFEGFREIVLKDYY